MSKPKTDITVVLGDLAGPNGNAFCILGTVRMALLRNGHLDLANEYMKEATSQDYEHLLKVTQEYVEVE